MLSAAIHHLLDHFAALDAPLFLSPVRTASLDDVIFRLELARVDFAVIPMGCACHVISDDPALAVYSRELVTMVRVEHAIIAFRLGRGRIRLSERWAAIGSRAAVGARGHGVELVGGLLP